MKRTVGLTAFFSLMNLCEKKAGLNQCLCGFAAFAVYICSLRVGQKTIFLQAKRAVFLPNRTNFFTAERGGALKWLNMSNFRSRGVTKSVTENAVFRQVGRRVLSDGNPEFGTRHTINHQPSTIWRNSRIL